MSLFSRRHYEHVAQHLAHRGSPLLVAEFVRLFQSADPLTFDAERFERAIEWERLSVSTGACLVLPKWSNAQWGAD